MGVREVKTYLISCDRCPVVFGTITAEYHPSLPPSWSSARVGDCGMTGYTRTDILCPMYTERAARKANE